MAHRVQSVSMIDQNILQAIFIGGEVIQYDLRKMLSILPQFQEIINDPSLASKVHADKSKRICHADTKTTLRKNGNLSERYQQTGTW